MRLALLSVATAALLGLAACGSSDSGGTSPPPAPLADPPPPPEDDPLPPPPPEDEAAGTAFSILVQRVNTQLGTSLECYSFYADGTVELRHGGNSQVSDTGSYSGDEESGEISWNSGRYTSYAWEGATYDVDGAEGGSIDSCLP